MSTRATYEFKDTDTNPRVCFYNHSDNYPEGAGYMFEAMLQHNRASRSLPEAFMRANERVEFTRAHESHADTEWRYTVSQRRGQNGELEFILKAEAEVFANGQSEWVTKYNGSLLNFMIDPMIAY